MSSLRTNLPALQAGFLLGMHQAKMADLIVKLATGRSLNRGADGPAGLIASESLKARLVELESQTQAMQRASHQARTADGAMGEASTLLLEANRLTVANADGTLSDEQKSANQAQINAIVGQVDRLSRTGAFGRKLLDGTAKISAAGSEVTLPSLAKGALGKTEVDGREYTLKDMLSGGSLDTKAQPFKAHQVIQSALEQVNTARGELGAFESNTLNAQRNRMQVEYENLSAAESLIVDTDYGKTIAELTRASILQNAVMSMMSLAFHEPRRLFRALE